MAETTSNALFGHIALDKMVQLIFLSPAEKYFKF